MKMRSLRQPLVLLALALALSCSSETEPSGAPEESGPEQFTEGTAPSVGQSGSEFFEQETPDLPPPGVVTPMPATQTYLDCPCERLAGSVPLLGTVTSWSASLLDLEVTEVPLDNPPEGSPIAGQHVLGVFLGGLPCYAGSYLPEPGDAVVGYLIQEQSLPNLCCDDCDELCQIEGGDVSDQCLSECQGPAAEACQAERENLPIAGQLLLAPFENDRARLATSTSDEYTVERNALPLVFEGGETCLAALGNTRDALPDATFGASWMWRKSCE